MGQESVLNLPAQAVATHQKLKSISEDVSYAELGTILQTILLIFITVTEQRSYMPANQNVIW